MTTETILAKFQAMDWLTEETVTQIEQHPRSQRIIEGLTALDDQNILSRINRLPIISSAINYPCSSNVISILDSILVDRYNLKPNKELFNCSDGQHTFDIFVALCRHKFPLKLLRALLKAYQFGFFKEQYAERYLNLLYNSSSPEPVITGLKKALVLFNGQNGAQYLDAFEQGCRIPAQPRDLAEALIYLSANPELDTPEYRNVVISHSKPVEMATMLNFLQKKRKSLISSAVLNSLAQLEDFGLIKQIVTALANAEIISLDVLDELLATFLTRCLFFEYKMGGLCKVIQVMEKSKFLLSIKNYQQLIRHVHLLTVCDIIVHFTHVLSDLELAQVCFDFIVMHPNLEGLKSVASYLQQAKLLEQDNAGENFSFLYQYQAALIPVSGSSPLSMLRWRLIQPYIWVQIKSICGQPEYINYPQAAFKAIQSLVSGAISGNQENNWFYSDLNKSTKIKCDDIYYLEDYESDLDFRIQLPYHLMDDEKDSEKSEALSFAASALAQPVSAATTELLSQEHTRSYSDSNTSIEIMDESNTVANRELSGTDEAIDKHRMTMSIAPKYMENAEPLFPRYLQRSTNSSQLPVISRQKEALQIHQISLHLLNQPQGSSLNTKVAPVEYSDQDNTIRLRFYNAQTRTSLQSEDACFFIMAGRVEYALLPMLSMHDTVRCVVVLTESEYEGLQLQQHNNALTQNYDFLVLVHLQLGEDQSDSLHAVTNRRRASLYFAENVGLHKMVMMDDNIEQFYVEPLEGAIGVLDALFAKISLLQDSCREPVVSITTACGRNDNAQYFNENHYLGSKAFMFHLDRIKNKLPPNSMWLALLPEYEKAYGEDYFMQIMTYFVFKECQGYKTLNPTMIQIERSIHHQNYTKNQGVLAKTLEAPSARFLNLLAPGLKETYNHAIALFNEKIKESYSEYERKSEHLKTMSFVEENARYAGIKLRPLPSSSIDFTPAFAEKMQHFLNQATAPMEDNQFKFYEHQRKALSFLLEQWPHSVTFDMATGSGKTLIQATIAFQALFSLQNSGHGTKKGNIMIVCPTVLLVEQTKRALVEYSKHPLFPNYYNCIAPRIIPICTGHVSGQALKFNKELQAGGHLFIVCYRSFSELILTCPDSIGALELIIYDESHQVEKDKNTEEIKKIISEHRKLTLSFSATPKRTEAGNVFRFTKEEGVMEGILTPLLVDRLPENVADEDLFYLIEHHRHPNGRPLKAHKGIIYVKNTDEARRLAQKLRDAISEFPVFEIHTQNNQHKQALEGFKTASSGLAIAVRMLVEGFNEASLNFIIVNKEVSVETRIQIVGRALRKNADYPDKIALVLLTEKTCALKPAECSLIPKNSAMPYYQTVATVFRDRELHVLLHARLGYLDQVRSIAVGSLQVLNTLYLPVEWRNAQISDGVRAYLEEHLNLRNQSMVQDILIPINRSGFWTGIRLQRQVEPSQHEFKCIFYHQRGTIDQAFVYQLRQVIRPLFNTGRYLTLAPCIEAPDHENQHAFFVENIYCDLKTAYSKNNTGWWDPKAENLSQAIQARHQHMLRDHSPPGFFKPARLYSDMEGQMVRHEDETYKRR